MSLLFRRWCKVLLGIVFGCLKGSAVKPTRAEVQDQFSFISLFRTRPRVSHEHLFIASTQVSSLSSKRRFNRRSTASLSGSNLKHVCHAWWLKTWWSRTMLCDEIQLRFCLGLQISLWFDAVFPFQFSVNCALMGLKRDPSFCDTKIVSLRASFSSFIHR